VNFYDTIFIIQFIIVIGLLLYKLYNVINKCEVYGITQSIIIFVLFWIAWGAGFVTLMLNPKLIYSVLFQLETWFIIPLILFVLIELFFMWHSHTTTPVKPYNAKDNMLRV